MLWNRTQATLNIEIIGRNQILYNFIYDTECKIQMIYYLGKNMDQLTTYLVISQQI